MGSPPADEGGNERRRLLTAARAVLARRAWSHVKIEGILREAGLSRRAFYRHFESKDHLLLALLDEESAAGAARLTALSSADAHAAPEDRVFAWIDAVMRLVRVEDHARRTSLFAGLWNHLERDFPDEVSGFRERLLAPLVGALADGRQGGAFPGVDPHDDALAIYYLVSGFVRERATHRTDAVSDSDVVRRFVAAALSSPGES
jgi:AcrR family transcriptional regulator